MELAIVRRKSDRDESMLGNAKQYNGMIRDARSDRLLSMSPSRTICVRVYERSPSVCNSSGGEGALSGSTFCLWKVTVSVGHAFPACLSRMFCSEDVGVRVSSHSPPRRRVRGPAQSGARGGEPHRSFNHVLL